MHANSFSRYWTAAIILIVAAAVGQCFVFERLLELQRAGVAFIDSSGITRMHSQRIAYLLAMAHGGTPEPGWRHDVDASIAAVSERWHGDESGVLTKAKPYFGAARALERRPSDDAAFDVLRQERPRILLALQTAVHQRGIRMAQRNDDLIRALFAGLCLQLGTIAGIWFGLIRPAQRRLRESLAEVGALRSEVQSLFDENPDAIAVYDRDGFLLRTNRARATLLGVAPADLIGRHCLTFIAPAIREQAMRVFERACNGEFVAFDSQLENSAGETIDVQMNVFPNLVANANAGAIAVSRNVSELRRAQAESTEMSRRLAALCEIVSTHDGDWLKAATAALALSASRLGYQWGSIGEVANGAATVIAIVGEPPGLQVGRTIPLEATLTQRIVNSDGIFDYPDLLDSTLGDYNLKQGTAFRNVIAMKLQRTAAPSDPFFSPAARRE